VDFNQNAPHKTCSRRGRCGPADGASVVPHAVDEVDAIRPDDLTIAVVPSGSACSVTVATMDDEPIARTAARVVARDQANARPTAWPLYPR